MITNNDIKNAKLKSSLAGNSMTDPCVLEEQFNEICSEFGLNVEDTYEWCEFRNESTFLEAV